MDADRAKVIDELGAITKRLAPYRDDIKREDALRKKVRTWPAADKLAPTVSIIYTGNKHTATVGAAEEERSWKPGAYSTLFGLLKKAKFLAMCGVTLKAATEAVGEATVADLVVTERTGSRPLIVTERTA